MGVKTLTARQRVRSVYQPVNMAEWSMCRRKVKFKTKRKATERGKRFYLCPFCKYYHRTSRVLNHGQ